MDALNSILPLFAPHACGCFFSRVVKTRDKTMAAQQEQEEFVGEEEEEFGPLPVERLEVCVVVC